jgi:hypothetical protein
MGKRDLQVFHVSCFLQFIKTVLVQSTTKGNARIRSERRNCDLVNLSEAKYFKAKKAKKCEKIAKNSKKK